MDDICKILNLIIIKIFLFNFKVINLYLKDYYLINFEVLIFLIIYLKFNINKK